MHASNWITRKHFAPRLLAAALLVAAAVSGVGGSLPAPAAAAAPQEYKLGRLYVHVSARGYRLYKLDGSLPSGLSDGPWNNEGPLCIVARDAGPGLRPIYQLMKADAYGVRFDYASSEAYAEEAGSRKYDPNYWTNQGAVFYVAATQLPGTTPLYRLRKNPGILAVGPNAGKQAPGSDATFLTVDPAVREQMLSAGWKNGYPIGYVWTKAPGPGPLPDLIVRQTAVEGNTIRAVVANQGKTNVSSDPGVAVQLVLLDRDGKQVYTVALPAGGMSPGQSRPVVFDVSGQSLVGRRYLVRVDHMNRVKESDETNNATEPAQALTVKVNSLPAGYVPPPSIRLNAVQPSPTQALPQRTLYRLAVTNPESYAPLLQPTQKLPPNPCGDGNTDARLLARIHVLRGGQALNAGCKPLRTASDLKELDVNSTAPLGDGDRLRVTLEDREAGQKYESQPYAVGWFGLDKTLVPAGCKYFLGRQGSFLCANDQGMAACEALRQKGKPIQCTRAGKPQ